MGQLSSDQSAHTQAHAAQSLAVLLSPDRPAVARSVLQAGGAEVSSSSCIRVSGWSWPHW